MLKLQRPNTLKLLSLGVCALCLTGVQPAAAFEGMPAVAGTLRVDVSGEQDVAGAKSFIDSMAQRAIGFLDSDEISEEQRKEEFRKLLNDSFDMKTIGRFSLGTYWKQATAPQQQEYQTLFKNMIVEVYSRRFGDYNGQKLDVRSAAPTAKGDTLVTTFIVPADGPEIQVDWRVRKEGGQFKIVDVLVEGVSMALTQRADFASVIQRGGGNVEVLLEHLRK